MRVVSLKNMDPVLIAALSKSLADASKQTRDTVPVGEHNLDEVVTLHVTGAVSVSADTEKAPTSSIPMLPTLALLLKRMGVQREKAMTMIFEVMKEALELGKDATAELLAETGVAEAEEALKEQVIARLPKTPVKGQVRVKTEVQVIGAPTAE